MKTLHEVWKGLGVAARPKPTTCLPASRSLLTSGAKSESELTMQKPSMTSFSLHADGFRRVDLLVISGWRASCDSRVGTLRRLLTDLHCVGGEQDVGATLTLHERALMHHHEAVVALDLSPWRELCDGEVSIHSTDTGIAISA